MAAAVALRLRRVDAGEPFGQRRGHLLQALGVEVEVRVALGVHVAHAAVDVFVGVDQPQTLGGEEHAVLPVAHLRVARALLQHRQPALFERGAGAHRQVGPAQAPDQRRARLDVVGVLQGMGGRGDLRIRRQHAGQCGPFGLAGVDLQRRGRQGSHAAQGQQCRGQQAGRVQAGPDGCRGPCGVHGCDG
jgi:hypothetical protein